MFCFLPVLVFLLTIPAEAGNRFWEHSLVETIHKNATLQLAKRAMSFDPMEGSNGALRWPNKKVKYCFDEAPTAAQRGMVKAGTQKWAVLKANGFTFDETLDSSVCKKNRKSTLLVKFNNEGKLATTIGMSAEGDGPVMHLDMNKDLGFGDIDANAAHEWGHALGLLHEHQNGNFWKVTFADTQNGWIAGSRGQTFPAKYFNCQSLKDYEKVKAKVDAEGSDQDQLQFCARFPVARKFDFSASEWLPIEGMRLARDSQVDLGSIMLYSSYMGAKEGADPVMKLGEDKLLPVNKAPSTQDIARLLTFYGAEKKKNPGLLPESKEGSRALKKIRSFIALIGGDKPKDNDNCPPKNG
ncbi:hypothetical protein BGZ63DRAFT_394560 [Mariannaea sp. PMI_226]|nr:hypothetical protein BGZ63DRAFT_394560 [Mariannaea sp. PMI_226]